MADLTIRAGTGQCTQQDPIGIAGGANVYGFANGDPVNFSDPFGRKAEESAADDGQGEEADPCETDPRSEACQARNRMKDLAASYCSSAKKVNATIYSGGTFEVALGWGLSVSMGAYASPSEFGTYVRGGLHFGLEGSLTSETGVAFGGLSGVALAGSAGTTTAVAGAVGFYPSLSGTAAIQSGPGIPLSGSASLTYTHTFPIDKCR